MTAKPAAATSPTNSKPIVSSASTTIAAAVWSSGERVPMPVALPDGRKRVDAAAAMASNRIVTCAGGSA